MEEVVFQGKKYPIFESLSPKTDNPRQSIPLRQLRIANAGIKRLDEIEGIFDANIESLDLRGNEFTSLAGIENLPNLVELTIGDKIAKLENLQEQISAYTDKPRIIF